MFVLLIILELAAVATLIAEIWMGIAVTGWQGKKPYVLRTEAPAQYWFVIVIQAILGLGIPGLLIYYQF